ncbi:MAG: ABC transporter substrate-binding protein [Spirochaetales bacterium]|nr:ABC transporter substrate-binding protein [Spirochaetales bacterium]
MKKTMLFVSLVILQLFFYTHIVFAGSGGVLNIYIDADRTGAKASGISIEQGVRLALSEINNKINDYKIELVIRDHHGSSKRSALHLKEFVNDPNGLAVFSGLHSPPVFSNLDYMNEKEILLLDPWAAAGPITRTTDSSGRNWIFRLSVDDTRAGEIITAYAVDREGFKKPALLLEDTPWGRSNESSMITALEKRGLEPLDIIWFNWNLGENGARVILTEIYSKEVDVIFMVANAPEGITFIKAMAERDINERLPIRSHWGITGGRFFETLGPEVLVDIVDLRFIQTSFSFLDPEQSPFSIDVFNRASLMFPEIIEPEDIKAPCGFIHSYDLTRILISALNQIEISEDIIRTRRLLRDALENITTPVQGLVKIYTKPFREYSEEDFFAHEALGLQDLKMAEYTKKGGIRLVDE